MCNKKQYELEWKAKKALCAILSRSSKTPWRDEMSVYLCEECEKYHISSKPTDYVPKSLRGKSYFEIQRDKWGHWLQQFSAKGAVINKVNKKYST